MDGVELLGVAFFMVVNPLVACSLAAAALLGGRFLREGGVDGGLLPGGSGAARHLLLDEHKAQVVVEEGLSAVVCGARPAIRVTTDIATWGFLSTGSA